MPLDWKAVISDKTKYPDDATFTVNGEAVTFGELRKQNTASQGELEQQLTRRSAELDTRDATQRRAVDTLARVLENVSARTGLTYDQLVKGEIPENLRQSVAQITRETRTDSGVQLKDDPLYKPLIEAVITPLAHDINLLKQAVGAAIGGYKNDHSRLAWLDFQSSPDRPADFNAKYEDVLQVAVNKGYKDELGFPDVGKAARELAGPIVQKADTAKVRKEGYDEGYQKARQEMLGVMGQPQPGTGGITSEPPPAKTGGKVPTIREQLEAAFNDSTIAGQMFVQ